MTVDTTLDEETDPAKDLMQADGSLTSRSDFWVGLCVLVGLSYGLLVAARVIFF